jgi:glycosyltransferase involved in cell wall biosynthesis
MELRPYYLAREWSGAGNRVTVVAGEYSHLRRQNPRLPHDLYGWSELGVDFCALKTPYYSKNDGRRAVNVISFTSKLWLYQAEICRRFAPDVVIVSSTHPFDFAPARRIAAKSGAALIFELHDIWPLSLIELYGFSPRHPMMRWIDAAERRALEQSDAVVSMLPGAAKYMAQSGIAPKRLEYIPNGAAFGPTQSPPAAHLAAVDALRQKYGFVVLYAGGFSAANAVDRLGALARRMPHIGFAAVGGGPLRAVVAQGAAQNLILLDAVDRRALLPLISMADALWLATRNLSVYRYGVAMNKLFDYMLSARPVVFATTCKDNPVSRAGCGITVDPQEMIQTETALEDLRAMSRKERDRMGRRGEAAVRQEYNYRHIAKKYSLILEELINAKQKPS